MTVRTAPPPAARETAIADLYALLALLLQYPTGETMEGLRNGTVKEDLRAIVDEAGFNENDCAAAFADLDELQHALESGSTDLACVRRERTRLFDHPDHPVVKFYEGVFIDDERIKAGLRSTGARLFVNPAALDAERCYRKAGVKRSSDINIPADCITTELEFMAHLHAMKAMALLENDGATSQDAQALMEEFVNLHVAKWFSRFFERCVEESPHALYRAVGTLGRALATVEEPDKAAGGACAERHPA